MITAAASWVITCGSEGTSKVRKNHQSFSQEGPSAWHCVRESNISVCECAWESPCTTWLPISKTFHTMIPIWIPTYHRRYTGSGCVRLGNRKFRQWIILRLVLCSAALLVPITSIAWDYLEEGNWQEKNNNQNVANLLKNTNFNAGTGRGEWDSTSLFWWLRQSRSLSRWKC